MLFHKSMLILSLVLSSLATGCTTRYQDMLRDRDERIRELSGQVAHLRGENDDLSRRSAAGATTQAVAAAAPRTESSSLVSDVQNEVGSDAEVGYSRGRLAIGVEDSVTFASGSTDLKDSSHKVLRSVASVLKSKFVGRRFYVEGHTDSDPIQKTKDKYDNNRHLSALRANAVASYLERQGVPANAIVVVGFGEHDPRDPGQKARNRRVQIVVGESL
jgi:chemotaxis protein MotB